MTQKTGRHTHEGLATYFYGAHGTLADHTPGLYIVEGPSTFAAYMKLRHMEDQKPGVRFNHNEFQPIKGEWAEALRDTIDQIRNREKEYYTDLGNGVFYVEI